jgi:preprotein translocase subunit SecF
MKYKWLYFAISLLVVIPGLYSLFRYGLRLSIDFTGGSLLEIQAPKDIASDEFSVLASAHQFEISSIQSSPDHVYILRTQPISLDQKDKFISSLNQKFENVLERRFETVGPTIGAQLRQKSILAIIVSSICIVLYIAWSFNSIPKPYSAWKFGLCAIAALIHDILVVVGLFSLFGHYYHVEVDALFITALLTVIGFSVHDTIVVFDRIRENLSKFPKSTFASITDFSLTETLNRSLNTSLTVILTLTALLLFGGSTIRWFVVALLMGITSGTFSSIFNAAPLLVMWETPRHTKQT